MNIVIDTINNTIKRSLDTPIIFNEHSIENKDMLNDSRLLSDLVYNINDHRCLQTDIKLHEEFITKLCYNLNNYFIYDLVSMISFTLRRDINYTLTDFAKYYQSTDSIHLIDTNNDID